MTAGALAACALLACSPGAGEPSAPAPPVEAAPEQRFRSVRTIDPVAAPVRVRIPAAGVDAVVTQLGRLPDGTVDVPTRYEDVGWYAGGPRPGEPGPAVLLGHVDSRAGPAVFARLPGLAQGDAVEVVDADGGTTTFLVERVVRFPKSRFPTEEVYLPTLRTELRLVTCGGRFDRASGHYVDNVVAFAVVA